MEGPFYPGFWSSPARPRGAPTTMAKPSGPAKVVSIPVHFINSDEKEQRRSTATPAAPAAASRPSEHITTSAAALHIQRVFRGFLVRKNLRVVRRLEAEVDAVEREVNRAGERLRHDAKERLRVSESLMSLLFRLDSVRGVRDYRRRVIRRAIALQEALDAMAAGEEASEEAAAPGNSNATCETQEARAPMPMEIPRSTDSNVEALEDHVEALFNREEDREKKVDEENSAGTGIAEEFKQEEGEGAVAGTVEEALEIPTEEALGVESASETGSSAVAMGEASEDHDGEEDRGKKVDEDDSAGSGVAEEFKQEEGEGAAAGTMEEALEIPTEEALGLESSPETGSSAVAMGEASEDHDGEQLGDVIQASAVQDEGSGQVKTGESSATGEMPSCPAASAPAPSMVEEGGQGCGDNLKQVRERMVEESKGLKGLVAELCERNEMQLCLMDGLLQRVESLEKIVEKMARKKKKRQAADAKKCCARKCERNL